MSRRENIEGATNSIDPELFIATELRQPAIRGHFRSKRMYMRTLVAKVDCTFFGCAAVGPKVASRKLERLQETQADLSSFRITN